MQLQPGFEPEPAGSGLFRRSQNWRKVGARALNKRKVGAGARIYFSELEREQAPPMDSWACLLF